MINTKFEAYKIERELKRSGKYYEFKRKGLNTFGEPTDAEVSVGKLFGLFHYHSSRNHIDIFSSEAARIRVTEDYMILCTKKELENIDLQVGDTVIINGIEMKYTATTDIQGWGIIFDVSLEVVDHGNKI